MRTVGVILAGGRSSRMGGGDKTLLDLGRTTMLGSVIERLSPQVEKLAINANGDPQRFAHYKLTIFPDTFGAFDGPLAGVLAAMEWAENQGVETVVTVAGDTPFPPFDLVDRLKAATPELTITVAASNGRTHPTFALWPTAIRADLAAFLAGQKSRRVNDFIALHAGRSVDFPVTDFDPFFNVNTPEDLEIARTIFETMS